MVRSAYPSEGIHFMRTAFVITSIASIASEPAKYFLIIIIIR